MKTLGRILAAGLVIAIPTAVVLSAMPARGAEASAAAMTAPAPAAKGYMASAKEVEHVQIALAKSGADVAIDGIWGPKTTQALKTFQKAHNLKVTGYPDKATMKVLGGIG
jgi:peptidoglycan hydrolase-like protein with peptidoglycan-binding domain